MRYVKILLLASLFLLPFLGCNRHKKPDPVETKEVYSSESSPDHLILVLLPGRGLKPIYDILEGAKTNGQLLKLRTTGILETNTFFGNQPDDLAFLSSLATGKTTYRGAIGVNKDSLPEETLIEHANTQDWETALFSAGYLASEYSAPWIAHQKVYSKEEIPQAFGEGKLSSSFGYGRRPFIQNKILEKLNLQGYEIALDSSQMAQISTAKSISVLGNAPKKANSKDLIQSLKKFNNLNISYSFQVIQFNPQQADMDDSSVQMLGDLLSDFEARDDILFIALSYPQIFGSDSTITLRSSIGGISSFLAFGPGQEKVEGLHSTTDFSKILKGFIRRK